MGFEIEAMAGLWTGARLQPLAAQTNFGRIDLR
jgi:hypothetical protein